MNSVRWVNLDKHGNETVLFYGDHIVPIDDRPEFTYVFTRKTREARLIVDVNAALLQKASNGPSNSSGNWQNIG